MKKLVKKLKSKLEKTNRWVSLQKKMIKRSIRNAKNTLLSILKSKGFRILMAISLTAYLLANYELPSIPAVSMPSLSTPANPKDYTVMITNIEGTGGGSGSVYKATNSESFVITNAHVCEGALKKGGVVKTVAGSSYMVSGYRLGMEHDLCVVTVAANLGSEVKLSSRPPRMYEKATVTGHPSLLPNMITDGHFSGKLIINLMMGAKKCKPSDYENRNRKEYCMFFGLYPVIRSFEAQAITATIMPGSSGSAVLNSDGELSGLVFAGHGRGISYGFIVPYEYVVNFLNKEAFHSEDIYNKSAPWISGDGEEGSEEDEHGLIKGQEAKAILEKKCQEAKIENDGEPVPPEVKKICKKLNDYLVQ